MFRQWMTVFRMRSRSSLQSGAADAASRSTARPCSSKMGCWQCHGTVAQGGGPAAHAPVPFLMKRSRLFLRTTSRRHAALSRKILSDADLADI